MNIGKIFQEIPFVLMKTFHELRKVKAEYGHLPGGFSHTRGQIQKKIAEEQLNAESSSSGK